jgi:hypothetical protein
MNTITRRAFGVATLAGGAQGARKPRGARMATPSTLRATVVANGTAAGDPATVLVDGADTNVTANGVSGYVPLTGDRVLVQQVGGQVEIIQFLDRTYITGQTIRTAASGSRWEITSGSDLIRPDRITGYSGHVSEVGPTEMFVTLDSRGVTGGDAGVKTQSPYFGVAAQSYVDIWTSRANNINGVDISGQTISLHGETILDQLTIAGIQLINGINFGNVTVTVPSGGSTGTTGNIAHGLPATPKYVGVIPNAATSLYFGYLAGGLTSTTMNLGARLISGTVGSNTNINLLWFAIC